MVGCRAGLQSIPSCVHATVIAVKAVPVCTLLTQCQPVYNSCRPTASLVVCWVSCGSCFGHHCAWLRSRPSFRFGCLAWPGPVQAVRSLLIWSYPANRRQLSAVANDRVSGTCRCLFRRQSCVAQLCCSCSYAKPHQAHVLYNAVAVVAPADESW